jgi:capsular exopolysaccharide synthesis family protein
MTASPRHQPSRLLRRGGRLDRRARRRAHSAGLSPWHSAEAFEEAFRVFRSNLVAALTDIAKPVVVVTSSNSSEGKSVVATRLALACAASRQRVVLVDLDLRHPTLHTLAEAHNEYGASDVLLGRRSLQDSLQHLEFGDDFAGRPSALYLLAAGPPVGTPSELLGSGRTARLLESLAREADIVLVDSPPTLPVADTLVIGRAASGAVLVVESGVTSVSAVEQAKNVLIRNQIRLLGVVVNKFEPAESDTASEFAYGY